MNITNPTHLRLSKGRLKTSSSSFTPKTQSGMTLIEVLIAMFVLATAYWPCWLFNYVPYPTYASLKIKPQSPKLRKI